MPIVSLDWNYFAERVPLPVFTVPYPILQPYRHIKVREDYMYKERGTRYRSQSPGPTGMTQVHLYTCAV